MTGGQKIAKARDAWMSSQDGEACLEWDSIARMVRAGVNGQRFLRNRLERAFLAGAQATIKINGCEQCPPRRSP